MLKLSMLKLSMKTTPVKQVVPLGPLVSQAFNYLPVSSGRTITVHDQIVLSFRGFDASFPRFFPNYLPHNGARRLRIE